MGPLASIRVLDLTRVRSGPAAVRQLADWGADVIKIEQPAQDDVDPFGGGERHSPDFQNLHRNKRSLTLNLKTPEGVAILKRLAENADVMLENYRPEVKWRLGIDYPAMREVNQRLVYASISGFGEDGPYRDRPGFDQIAQHIIREGALGQRGTKPLPEHIAQLVQVSHLPLRPDRQPSAPRGQRTQPP
jgi:formyl-CoA transferase